MSSGLYQGVAAMAAAEDRLEAITTNLANAGVDGFKRRTATVTSFDTVLRGRVQRQTTARKGLDFTQGFVANTGNTFDLALTGEGFFAVETPEGEAYTRNGRFHIDGEGVLLTQEGFQVAWDGPRGTIDYRREKPYVDPEGNVYQDDIRLGQLKLSNFQYKGELEARGSGYFKPVPGQRPAAHRAEVVQGALERSNVNAVGEMISMISIQRSFESSARLMQMIDQTYRRLNAPR
jgi:flagellar basal-body rod protein FlgG